MADPRFGELARFSRSLATVAGTDSIPCSTAKHHAIVLLGESQIPAHQPAAGGQGSPG